MPSSKTRKCHCASSRAAEMAMRHAGRELQGVADEVLEDLDELHAVGGDHRQRADVDHGVGCRDLRGQVLDGGGDRIGGRHRLERQRPAARGANRRAAR